MARGSLIPVKNVCKKALTPKVIIVKAAPKLKVAAPKLCRKPSVRHIIRYNSSLSSHLKMKCGASVGFKTGNQVSSLVSLEERRKIYEKETRNLVACRKCKGNSFSKLFTIKETFTVGQFPLRKFGWASANSSGRTRGVTKTSSAHLMCLSPTYYYGWDGRTYCGDYSVKKLKNTKTTKNRVLPKITEKTKACVKCVNGRSKEILTIKKKLLSENCIKLDVKVDPALIPCAVCNKKSDLLVNCIFHQRYECVECVKKCEELIEHGAALKAIGWNGLIKLETLRQHTA